MEKSRFKGAVLCMTALAMIVVSMTFGSFAKYTAQGSGSSSATVAKWSFTVNNKDIATDHVVQFDLFKTVKNTDGGAESNVATGKIAPGTSGQFEMRIKNASEVAASYDLRLEETNASNIPIQYSLDGKTWKDSTAELTIPSKNMAVGAPEDIVTIHWRWAFESGKDTHKGQTDGTDTTLGVVGGQTVTVKATITARQAD